MMSPKFTSCSYGSGNRIEVKYYTITSNSSYHEILSTASITIAFSNPQLLIDCKEAALI